MPLKDKYKIRCPNCKSDNLEYDGMSGYLKIKTGTMIYSEGYLCIGCDQVFDVEISMLARSKLKINRGENYND